MNETYAKEAIKKAIAWMFEEYKTEEDMPSFAYEATMELEHALTLLNSKKTTDEYDIIANFVLWYTHENEGIMYDALATYMDEASNAEMAEGE